MKTAKSGRCGRHTLLEMLATYTMPSACRMLNPEPYTQGTRSRRCGRHTLLEMLATYTMPSACPMYRAALAAPRPRGGCSTSIHSSKNAPASAPTVSHRVTSFRTYSQAALQHLMCLTTRAADGSESYARHALSY